MPPSPCTGSSSTAQTVSSTAAFIASRSLMGTFTKRSSMGSKPFWYLVCPVAEREPMVRP